MTDGHITGEHMFVYGCSRSGTTLLLNLFRAFADTTVVSREHRLAELLRYRRIGGNVVVKRTPICALDLSVELARQPHVWVIDIVRDPRDVVTSRYGGAAAFHTDFRRWERDVQAAENAERTHRRFLRVRFADLLTKPDSVQRQIADRIGLCTERTFAETAASLAGDADVGPKDRNALNGARPLDAGTLGRWRGSAESVSRVREQVTRYPDMAMWLLRYRFEPDNSWLSLLGDRAPAGGASP